MEKFNNTTTGFGWYSAKYCTNSKEILHEEFPASDKNIPLGVSNIKLQQSIPEGPDLNKFGHDNTRISSHSKVKGTQTKVKTSESNICDLNNGNEASLMEPSKFEQTFVCHLCSYRCTNQKLLKKHLLSHDNDKFYSCDICDYKCNWKQQLRKHKLKHLKNELLSCQKCDYKCIQKKDLTMHKSKHTNAKLYKCNICRYQSAQMGNLKKHKLKHVCSEPYSRNIYNYKCVDKDKLSRHAKSKHAETFESIELPHLPNDSSSSKHKVVHNEETSNKFPTKKYLGKKVKIFKCNFCKFQTFYKGSLTTHVRSHTGEKPYRCNYCDYKCSTSCNLRRHVNMHENVKPFVCDICDYAFARKISLINHKQRKHVQVNISGKKQKVKRVINLNMNIDYSMI